MAFVGLPVSSDVSDGCMGVVEAHHFPVQVAEGRARAPWLHRSSIFSFKKQAKSMEMSPLQCSRMAWRIPGFSSRVHCRHCQDSFPAVRIQIDRAKLEIARRAKSVTE